jgi:hypothetical protein
MTNLLAGFPVGLEAGLAAAVVLPTRHGGSSEEPPVSSADVAFGVKSAR